LIILFFSLRTSLNIQHRPCSSGKPSNAFAI
jgi:hypothetical protein